MRQTSEARFDEVVRMVTTSWKKVLILFLLVVGLVYGNSLEASFHLDDKPNIVDNRLIRDIPQLIGSWRPGLSRFVAKLTFAVNYQMNGLEVGGYHLVNLAVHVAAGFMVWQLWMVSVETPVMKGEIKVKDARWLGLTTALLFVTHPIQTQAVTYIIQRVASLATMFYVAAIYVYARARVKGYWKPRDWLMVGGLAVLAIYSKEMAVSLPVMIVAYELIFFHQQIDLALLKKQWRVVVAGVAGFGAAAYALKPVYWWLLIRPVETQLGEVVTPLSYGLTQLKVWFEYMQLILLPWGQNADHWVEVSSGLGGEEIIGVGLILALVEAGVWMVKRQRMVAFGLVWFVVTMLPESSVLPLPDVMFEHRLYLPMVGLVMAGVAGAYWWWPKKDLDKLKLGMLGLVVICGVLTWQRNKVWKDEISLWSDVVTKAQENMRAHQILGYNLELVGEYEGAQAEYLKARELRADNVVVVNDLGRLMGLQGRYGEAEEWYRKALEINPKNLNSYNGLGNLRLNQGRLEEAEEFYLKALENSGKDLAAYNNLGYVYMLQERWEEAEEMFEQALKIDPEFEQAKGNLEYALDKRVPAQE